MSWPKRLKKAACAVSTATFAISGKSPCPANTSVACGRMLMPTPIALISGADSNTRQAIPLRASSRAAVSPPMPAPTIRTSCTSGVYCEVGLLQRAVARDFARRARRDHAPAFEHVGVVGQRQREAGHLVDEQDGRLLHAQLVERREEIVDHRGRKPERRLVEQQEPR